MPISPDHIHMLPYNAGPSLDDIATLQAEMKQFSTEFQNYTSVTTFNLHKLKQEHNLIIRELNNQKKKLLDENKSLIGKITEINETRDSTLQSLSSKQEKVHALAEQSQALQEMKKDLQKEIEEARIDLERLERSYSEVRKNMSFQSRKDFEELTKYEAYMGLKVEAVANDHLMFKFSNINSNSVDEEVYCHLHVGGEEYKVGELFPALSAEQTRSIEADLNEHGEIILFLKQVRNALRIASRIR